MIITEIRNKLRSRDEQRLPRPMSIAITIEDAWLMLEQKRDGMVDLGNCETRLDMILIRRDPRELLDYCKGLTIFGIDIVVAEIAMALTTSGREVRAEKLLRDMFMKCRDSQNINQHNPYTWAELNTDLMQRLKEFM